MESYPSNQRDFRSHRRHAAAARNLRKRARRVPTWVPRFAALATSDGIAAAFACYRPSRAASTLTAAPGGTSFPALFARRMARLARKRRLGFGNKPNQIRTLRRSDPNR